MARARHQRNFQAIHFALSHGDLLVLAALVRVDDKAPGRTPVSHRATQVGTPPTPASKVDCA
jgi:hypothetical protein